jgi:hypothetical protein
LTFDKGLLVVLFGQNHQGFVNISNFDSAESGEERSDLGNFIVGEGDHVESPLICNPGSAKLLGVF